MAVLRMSRGLKNEKQICSLSEKRNRVSHASLLSHFFGAQDQLGEGGPRACAESWIADASVEATTPGAVWSPAPTPVGSREGLSQLHQFLSPTVQCLPSTAP